MPTVLRDRGLRVVINPPPREHGPPHVHVWCADGQIVINLLPHHPHIADAERGVGPANAARALALIEEHIEFLMLKWGELHG